MVQGPSHFKRQQYMSEWLRNIILSLFPVRIWLFNKVTCRAQLYKKTNNKNNKQKNTPFKQCQIGQNIWTVNIKSVGSSSALPVAPPWVSNSFLLHQRFMLPEISFCHLFASEMMNRAVEKTNFICQRHKFLGAEGLKHNLPTASIKGISVARNLHSSVYKGTPVWEADPHFAQLLSTDTPFVMF